MTNGNLTLAVLASPRTTPLIEGEVVASDINVVAESIDTNSRAMGRLEFDINEVSIATFMRARELGVPVLALPIFPSTRNFPQSNFLFSKNSPARDLSELAGRTVGAAQYWTASSIWQRQFLHQEYGLRAEDMNWVTFQPERLEGLEVPAHLRHRLEVDGRSSEELATAGELDATLSRGAGRVRERESADAKPLLGKAFADPVAASREYYLRTGVYPVQHVVVMREDLAGDAAVVERVCEAFARAKEVAQTREDAAATNDFLDDAWPYGISANRNTLEAFVGAAHEQGLTNRLHSVEELFPANLPDEMR